MRKSESLTLLGVNRRTKRRQRNIAMLYAIQRSPNDECWVSRMGAFLKIPNPEESSLSALNLIKRDKTPAIESAAAIKTLCFLSFTTFESRNSAAAPARARGTRYFR